MNSVEAPQAARAPVAETACGAEPATESSRLAVPRPSLRRHARRLALLLVVFGAVLCAAFVRSQGATAELSGGERGRIVEGATGLLARPAGGPAIAAPTLATVQADHPPRDAGLSGAAGESSRSGADASAGQVERVRTPAPASATATSPATELAPLRDFVRDQAKPDLRALVQLTQAESEALAPQRRAPERPLAPRARDEVRSSPGQPIPDVIEGTAPPARPGDALAPYTVHAMLRTQDAVTPFLLQEIRMQPGPARARFVAANPGAAPVPAVGWLEVGDAPLQGWRVIGIEAQCVTLLTPLGNPVRMMPSGRRVQPDGAAAMQAGTTPKER